MPEKNNDYANLAVNVPQGFLSGKKHGCGIISEPMWLDTGVSMNEQA